jgi:hypothetical protein
MASGKQALTKKLSRRSLFRTASYFLGAVPILGAILSDRALAQNKVAQAAVSYQDSPKGSQQCSNCAAFEAPHSCKTVAGDIHPTGWCSIWTAK